MQGAVCTYFKNNQRNGDHQSARLRLKIVSVRTFSFSVNHIKLGVDGRLRTHVQFQPRPSPIFISLPPKVPTSFLNTRYTVTQFSAESLSLLTPDNMINDPASKPLAILLCCISDKHTLNPKIQAHLLTCPVNKRVQSLGQRAYCLFFSSKMSLSPYFWSMQLHKSLPFKCHRCVFAA